MTAARRKFVPSEQDRRRASEVERKARELGQPVVASVLGVSVRTLQRYIKLERAMRAQDVDKFETHFGRADARVLDAGRRPLLLANGSASTLEPVLSRYEADLSLKQAKAMRDLESSGLHMTEQQWEHVIIAVLNARQPHP